MDIVIIHYFCVKLKWKDYEDSIFGITVDVEV